MTPREGKVVGVFEKPYHNVMLYSFKIEGDNTFYRLGQNKPEFKVGDTISFEDRNTNVSNVEVTVSSTASPQKDAPSVDVGSRIQYQAARADATRLVVAALHTDHLPHAANVAKNKRLDLLLGYVEEVTGQLLEMENKQ